MAINIFESLDPEDHGADSNIALALNQNIQDRQAELDSAHISKQQGQNTQRMGMENLIFSSNQNLIENFTGNRFFKNLNNETQIDYEKLAIKIAKELASNETFINVLNSNLIPRLYPYQVDLCKSTIETMSHELDVKSKILEGKSISCEETYHKMEKSVKEKWDRAAQFVQDQINMQNNIIGSINNHICNAQSLATNAMELAKKTRDSVEFLKNDFYVAKAQIHSMLEGLQKLEDRLEKARTGIYQLRKDEPSPYAYPTVSRIQIPQPSSTVQTSIGTNEIVKALEEKIDELRRDQDKCMFDICQRVRTMEALNQNVRSEIKYEWINEVEKAKEAINQVQSEWNKFPAAELLTVKREFDQMKKSMPMLQSINSMLQEQRENCLENSKVNQDHVDIMKEMTELMKLQVKQTKTSTEAYRDQLERMTLDYSNFKNTVFKESVEDLNKKYTAASAKMAGNKEYLIRHLNNIISQERENIMGACNLKPLETKNSKEQKWLDFNQFSKQVESTLAQYEQSAPWLAENFEKLQDQFDQNFLSNPLNNNLWSAYKANHILQSNNEKFIGAIWKWSKEFEELSPIEQIKFILNLKIIDPLTADHIRNIACNLGYTVSLGGRTFPFKVTYITYNGNDMAKWKRDVEDIVDSLGVRLKEKRWRRMGERGRAFGITRNPFNGPGIDTDFGDLDDMWKENARKARNRETNHQLASTRTHTFRSRNRPTEAQVSPQDSKEEEDKHMDIDRRPAKKSPKAKTIIFPENRKTFTNSRKTSPKPQPQPHITAKGYLPDIAGQAILRKVCDTTSENRDLKNNIRNTTKGLMDLNLSGISDTEMSKSIDDESMGRSGSDKSGIRKVKKINWEEAKTDSPRTRARKFSESPPSSPIPVPGQTSSDLSEASVDSPVGVRRSSRIKEKTLRKKEEELLRQKFESSRPSDWTTPKKLRPMDVGFMMKREPSKPPQTAGYLGQNMGSPDREDGPVTDNRGNPASSLYKV